MLTDKKKNDTISRKGGGSVETHERIKHLRKEILHLTRREFGDRLGVSESVIVNIELNRLAKPEQKEPLIKLICKEFNVNYSWLKDGIGDMESDFSSSIIDDLVKEYDLDDTDRLILENYMKLDKEARKALSDYLKSLTSLWQKEQ